MGTIMCVRTYTIDCRAKTFGDDGRLMTFKATKEVEIYEKIHYALWHVTIKYVTVLGYRTIIHFVIPQSSDTRLL